MITTFCKAKYFAKKYKLPFLYKPFSYSDQFALHSQETILNEEHLKQFSKVIEVTKLEDIENNLQSQEPILFECHFLSITPPMYFYSREDRDFEQAIKSLFAPIIPIAPLPKPEGVITVALHVRKGGGFDKPLASAQEYAGTEQIKGLYLFKKNPSGSHDDIWPIKWPVGTKYAEAVKKYVTKKNNCSDYIWPIKFPPDQYYIDQLKELAKMLPGKNLLVYLFTDDPNPENIMQRYSTALIDCPRIIFSYRQKGNHHTKNVLVDLFSIIQCDCLISASSSFAHAAQLLGNHAIFLFPMHAITFPDRIIMDTIGMITVQNAHDPQMRKLSYSEITNKNLFN
jgi:hypothetical protein